jgi:hypothetical protein
VKDDPVPLTFLAVFVVAVLVVQSLVISGLQSRVAAIEDKGRIDLLERVQRLEAKERQ